MTRIDQTAHGPDATAAGSPALTEAERHERAVRQVAAIKGFYAHLGVFIVVMAVLVLIDALTGSRWWVQWVFLGWGIGVLAHAVAVYGHRAKFVADWEDRKIKELMDQR